VPHFVQLLKYVRELDGVLLAVPAIDPEDGLLAVRVSARTSHPFKATPAI
jgi:hypothetical protein